MNWKPLLTSVFLLSFSPLVAQACPQGNPQSLAYILREDNRCEGLLPRQASTTGFDLISLSTGKAIDGNYPATLSIRVPITGNTPPEYFEIQSSYKNYLLNKVTFSPGAKGFTFPLKTTILQKAEIPSKSLEALAFFKRNGKPIHIPVILGTVSDKYDFILYSSERRSFPTVEIRSNGRTFKLPPQKIPKKYIYFTWSYQNAPPGIYELYLVDDQNQPRSFWFQHNPSLF
ncbi:hypothetical protein BZZ01_18855 [Nostocales cyanobacterium HT-58-2]|nr:hypothetical protein BZZ01_18855 [Nostocales cyanobacterium HT-58-2]